MMANRTRGARGGLKLNRTLGESPCHRLADSAQTPKEKTLLDERKSLRPAAVLGGAKPLLTLYYCAL